MSGLLHQTMLLELPPDHCEHGVLVRPDPGVRQNLQVLRPRGLPRKLERSLRSLSFDSDLGQLYKNASYETRLVAANEPCSKRHFG